MPFVTSGIRRGGRLLAGLVGLGLLFAGPAAAGATTTYASNTTGCVVGGVFTKPFAPWGDFANYAIAPGGNFESGAQGWSLTGGAAVADGNQPFNLGTTGGTKSLSVPDGGVATSAPMCIDSTYPHFRLVARNTGKPGTGLRVEVLFLNEKGGIKSSSSGTVYAGSTDWFMPDSLKIGVYFNPDVNAGAAPVNFRFRAEKDSAWRIDDVYVDPYARG